MTLVAGAALGVAVYLGALAFAGRFSIAHLFVGLTAVGAVLWIAG